MSRASATGKLKIGDDWNAITIIALAQSNPLKAVAEFVENSIDAGARHVTITRGKEKGEAYLAIADDGEGVRRDADGKPDFKYVATHICDSFKRRLKARGVSGVQGEFGIGLLSFWTLGQNLFLTSAGADGRNYQMRMERENPSYSVTSLRTLIPLPGTELKVKPLLPGIRHFSGEKLEWYLASELRDRIRQSRVDIRIVDHQARKEYRAAPRQFDGELLHQLPQVTTPLGAVYLEIYLAKNEPGQVGLYRGGTRVLEHLGQLEDFAGTVWTGGVLEGIVDASFLSLTPGTRSGVIRDAAYHRFVEALEPATARLDAVVEAHRRAEEEQASEQMVKSLQRAFREALLSLPVEDYDFFDIRYVGRGGGDGARAGERAHSGVEAANGSVAGELLPDLAEEGDARRQRDFFEFPGPLHNVLISPASGVVRVGETLTLRAACRDRSGRSVIQQLHFVWRIVEGEATLDREDAQIVKLRAGNEPGLVKVHVTVLQAETSREAEALVTVTAELTGGRDREGSAERAGQGLPGYTMEHAPGRLWRSRFDEERNLIVVNSGHRDFVYSARSQAMKLRYIARLYAKELVQKNFPGAPSGEVLERMVELTLYMEPHLR
jgi:hypothetical protein